jgi:hypothetical protein
MLLKFQGLPLCDMGVSFFIYCADPLSTSISFNTIQRELQICQSRSNTLSQFLGGQTSSQVQRVQEPGIVNAEVLVQVNKPVGRTPPRQSPDSRDGKRKKKKKPDLGEDVEADPCAGTSDHGIEGTSPDQNQVLESPEVATGKFPAKKRKKTMHQKKTKLA